jgi:hypothetical protein
MLAEKLTPRDHRPTALVVSKDFKTMLDQHPEAFDCLIFKANLESATTSQENVLVQDFATGIESDSLTISYADPIPSRAKIHVEEGQLFSSYADGGDSIAGSPDDSSPMVLLLKEDSIPRQSVVMWKEMIGQDDTEIKEVYMYILHSASHGVAPVIGVKHYCIPFDAIGELEVNE